MLWVNEIFYSIQGEGYHAGMPALFVRLAGCNLDCPWCDTNHETKKRMEEEEIIGEIFKLANGRNNLQLVVITGGEPLMQALSVKLADKLQMDFGLTVAFETNGTLYAEGCEAHWLTVSPKPVAKLHPDIKAAASEFKYIVRNNCEITSGLPALCEHPPEEFLKDHRDRIFLQPCDEGELQRAINTRAALESCLKHGYRLSVQIHKTVGVR